MAYLQQLRDLFLRLAMRQRLYVGAGAVVVIVLIAGLRHWQTESNFKPLFQELSSEDAGMVMARLKEAGTEVRLADGGKTIKVPAGKVDELRIQMATAGLPKSGRIGFELFDKPNFGTSEFAEQVNYHRAVEGELERSVMALQEVESARVHITFPRQSLFLENRQPAKASVLLKLKLGSTLSPQNIQAIAHLASSAVDGLAPENVSILDMKGNLFSHPRRAGDADEESSRQLIEYRERMEKDLRQKIQATLEPLLGADGFRTAVSLDCDLASGDQSEETFDPAGSVMVNSQRSEDGAGNGAAGVPGTPSNLPRPTSRPGAGSGGPVYRKSENTTFQTSRVIRHVKFPHGKIRRLSASVLLDYVVKDEGGKQKIEAPAPERLRAIKDIVSATVGFQQERGDQIIVEALQFENTRLLAATPAAPQVPARPRLHLPQAIPDWLREPLEGHLNWFIGQKWLPGLVIALLLGILYGVYRAVRAAGAAAGNLVGRIANRKKKGDAEGEEAKGQHVDVTLEPALDEGKTAGQLEAGGEEPAEEELKPLSEQLRERDVLQEKMTLEAVKQLEVPKAQVHRSEVLTRHIMDLSKKDPEAVANLIRTWMESQER